MKSSLLFLMFFLLCNELTAQTNFSTAVEIAAGESKTGTVAPANRNFYFKTLLPADGTVTVFIEGENKQGSAGSITLYAYDKDQRQIAVNYTLGGKNIAEGEKFKDTVRIYSRNADSIYLRLYQGSSQTFNFSIRYAMEDEKASDPEPNDSFSQPAPLEHQQKVTGNIGYVKNGGTDRSDYYKTLLPKSGTVTVYIDATHTGGGSGSISLYAYDKDRRQVYVKYALGGKNLSLGEKFKDTLRIYSRSADSIYLRLYQGSSQSFSYSLQYEVTNQNIEDAEPNNDFSEAAPIAQQETVYGRIGNIAAGNTDRNDYFKTLLPETGTVRVYVDGVHTGGSAGSISLYAYDKDRRQVAVNYTLGGKNISLGESFSDTIDIPSRAADSLYFRIYQGSSQSFDYSIRYEMIRLASNDAEPNNSAAEALPIAPHDTLYGQIGHVANGVTDRNDYYLAKLPADGTATIYIRGTHTGGSAGSLSLYVYDKSQRQVGVKYTLGGSNITLGENFSDTVRVFSRTADTLYLRIYQGSSQSFNYAISYEVLDQSTNDIEPNNDLPQAQPLDYQEVEEGHIGYVADGNTDRNDYYLAKLPADGTVTVYIEGTHTGGSNGSISLYVYDKSNRQVGVNYTLGGKNIGYGESFKDTVQVFSRAADSVYFRVYQGSSQSFNYSISYDVLDQSTNDAEPNDNLKEAQLLPHQETVAGHIGYIADGITDRNDYYLAKLPASGTINVYVEGTHTGGSNGSITFYAYDKSNRQLSVSYTLGGKNIGYGSSFKDTVQLTSRADDSLYFRIYQGSSQSFKYTIRYEVLSPGANDQEPNNSFEQAVTVAFTDTIRGSIGHTANGVTDMRDYYLTAVPAHGNLTVLVEARNTGSVKNSLDIYVYSKKQQLQARRLTSSVEPGALLKDTLTINCFALDSIYVLIYEPSSSRSFSYQLQFELDPQQPKAVVGYNRSAETYEFVNQSTGASKYTWNISNGEEYTTVAPPLITFTQPGAYNVRLIAENELCRVKDTAVASLTVKGLTRYTPDSGGTGNIVFTAYGGGFHKGMAIELKQGNIIYKDSVSWVDERGSVFSAMVDMHKATPGVYDVSFITKDTTYNYPGGFVCEGAIYKVSGEIIGRDIIRANRNNSYKVRIYNEGNVMAGHTEVYLLTPNNLEVTLLDSLLDLEFETVDADTLPDVIQVTKARGYPIDGQVRAYLLAGIPAGGYRDLNFNIKGTVGAENVYLWVKGPYSGSPYTADGADCLEATLKAAAGLIWDGLSLVPAVDCAAGILKGVASSLYSGVSYFVGFSDKLSTGASLTKSFAGATKDCAGEIAAATGIGVAVAPALEIADIVTDVTVLSYNLSVNAKEIYTDCFEMEDKKEKKVDVRNSFDPNAKSGPSGFGAARYISGVNRRMSYTIFFENLETATLPAQEVLILDTLDKNVYDLSSFRADSYGWADSAYNLPLATGDYLQDIPLNNELAVRFFITLNKETGVIKASFKTIDRATGAITEDPLAGFLPPNINGPEGEGFVSFSIDMKPGLADGTVIANSASIVFDNNEPIATEIWSNTIDRNLPSSRIIEAYQLTDSTIVVKVNGSDPASGVGNYKLYFSEEETPFAYLGKMKDSAIVTGTLGKTYDFYVQAVDEVGNLERKNSQSEARVKLTPGETTRPAEGMLLLYPVPSNGAITLELDVPEWQQVSISVYSTSGQRVAELYNGTIGGPLTVTKTLYQLSSGVYFVQATGSKGLNIKKKLVLVK
ncbi:MAG: DUF7619 domain-containing protein [Agriterribacter sp.]